MHDRREDDPAIRSLSERITITGDEALDSGGLRQSVGSVTEVRTARGAFVREVEFPLGAAENPLSDEDLTRKFVSLTADVLPEGRAGQIRQAVETLETLPDVRALTDLL